MSSSQKIGLTTAIVVGMNAMIGSGIFTIPSMLASQAGPAGILTTVLVGIMAWSLALSIAKVAEHFPEEGSFYNYSKQWGGHFIGMLASAFYLIGLCIGMGLLTKKAGLHMQHNFIDYNATILGSVTLLGLIVLNLFGAVLSEIGQYILIILTVFPLVATSILCLTRANINNLSPFAPFGITSIFSASRFVIFGFLGFESAASLYSIVENPKKNVPKAISYSLLIVAITYIIFAGSIILAIPRAELIQAQGFTSALLKMFPKQAWLINMISIAVFCAIIGTIHSMIWGAGRLLLSLAKVAKGKFVKNLVSKNIINEKTSVLFIGLCIFCTFLLLDNEDLFFSLTSIFIVLAFLLSIITILKIKHLVGKKDLIIGLIGLFAAVLIVYFAFCNITTNLIK